MLSEQCPQQRTSKGVSSIKQLTSMCLRVLSLGVLSWYKPSRWQFQVLESCWKIRERKDVISSEVVQDLLVILDSCCSA